MKTRMLLAVIVSLAFVFASRAGAANGTNTTAATQTANWSALSWGGGAPNGIGDVAAFRFGADQNITLDQNVTLGRLDEIGTGQLNLKRSGSFTLTMDNTVAGGPASILLSRTNGDTTARTLSPNMVLNSDTIVTWARPQVRSHGIGGIISGAGRLSLNYAIAPTEGADAGTTNVLNGTSGHTIYIGTAGDAASSYTGGTDLRASTNSFTAVRFYAAKADALGTGTSAGRLYMYQAALDLGNFDQTAGGLSGGTGGSRIGSLSTNAGATTLRLNFDGSHGPFAFCGTLMDGGTNGAVRLLALAKAGSGTQTLGGTNTYSGGTTISAGTLAVSNNQALGAGVVNLAGGTLAAASGVWALTNAVNLSGASTVDTAGNALTLLGPVTNSGALTKTGAGTLELAGPLSYAGATAVSNGTLKIQNPANSGLGLLSVYGGATLGGTGRVGAVTIAAGGCLAPGNSAGRLVMAGDLTLNTGGHLQLELGAPDGTAGVDNDFVTGVANLTLGGSLDLVAVNGFGTPAMGSRWRVLSYGGTTNFEGVAIDGSAAPLGAGLSYALDAASSAGEVYLTVIPEPCTSATLALFAAALWLRRRLCP